MGERARVVALRVTVAALLLVGLLGLAVVEEPFDGTVDLPGTRAGRQLEWVLHALVQPPAEGDLANRFNAAFLEAVPPPQLLAVLKQVGGEGPFTVTAVERSLEHSLVVLLKGTTKRFRTSIEVEPEPPHRIAVLGFQSPTSPYGPVNSWGALDARLRNAAPEVGFLAAEISRGTCRPVHAVEPDTSLSLGSVFKLYVLGAAAEAVRSGRLKWDTEIEVRDEARVHTSARTAEMDNNQPVALEELATHMIEVSDNTATDLVLDAVGREAVEAEQAKLGMAEPERNIPFLTTRELSLLKFVQPSRVEEYLSLDLAARRRFLAVQLALRPALVEDLQFAPLPVAVDTLEWFASAADLCRVHVALQAQGKTARDIVGRNPGVYFGPDAEYVAFKGGSEPGVLAGSWYVEHRDGRRFAISILLRNKDGSIDTTALSVAADAFRLAAG